MTGWNNIRHRFMLMASDPIADIQPLAIQMQTPMPLKRCVKITDDLDKRG